MSLENTISVSNDFKILDFLNYHSGKIEYRLENTDKRITLLRDTQGSGKTYTIVKYYSENDKTVIIFTQNHEIESEIIQDVKNKDKEFSFLTSRTYPLTESQKDIISHILFVQDIKEKIKQNYTCNKCCKDKDFLNMVRKGYLTKTYCRDICEFRSNGCLYMDLKNIASQTDEIGFGKEIFLNISYLNTNFPGDLVEKHKDMDLVFDEGFMGLLFELISFPKSLKIKDYIKLVDKVFFEYNNPDQEEIWLLLKEILKCIINKDKKIYSIRKKKNKIIELLENLTKIYTLKEIEEWSDYFKSCIIENKHNKIKLEYNQFPNLFKIFIDVYNIKENDIPLKDRIDIDKNLLFNYLKNTRKNVVEIIEKSNHTTIPASGMSEEMFYEIMPEFKDKVDIIYDPNIIPQFKRVNKLTSGNYAKYTLISTKTNQFTSKYYNLLKKLKQILLKHKNEKIFITAFKRIKNQLKFDLKEFIKKYNIQVEFEHFYNTDGKNKFKDFDVGIQFGSCQYPVNIRKLISRCLNIPLEILTELYGPIQSLQMGERLRTLHHPFEKILYIMSNFDVKNSKFPESQIHNFNCIPEEKYNKFIKKLKDKGLGSVEECLEIYNSCEIRKISTIKQIYSILNNLIKEGIVEKIKKKPLVKKASRPKSYYKVVDNLADLT
ncbi:hypothetical protein DSAG12_01456 [Promethearchaeum syntrophicum]|uniref:Type III restriction enzyme, res subunit n=1 Tax=Promethearchaeum syntrophicum TaxID=2594042 RepID=A0A5B9DA51_9ARCH|nr:hypothetical protein [Candidatus Prometheoarchaeum syntrophicum]QEE15630.1 hypothetical protein DSAG12_01456 [Candidatus Prometheoarchaeum syntrophicum]